MHTTRLPKMLNEAKEVKKQRASQTAISSGANSRRSSEVVPKGHLAVYVGDVDRNTAMRRFVIPIVYLSHPLFQDLLRKVEEEFGFEHPMGGLTLPCTEQDFLSIVSQYTC